MIYTHSHPQLSLLITCIHHTTVPEHLLGAEYECVRHPLCLSSNHHCDIYFQVYFVGLTVTSHPYTHIIVILMNSSSHIIVILMNSSSHIVIIIISLNLLQTRISYLNHLAIFSFRVTLSQISSIKIFWWISHHQSLHRTRKKPLVGGLIQKCICRTRKNLLLAFVSFQNISKCMPNKELCLLLALSSHHHHVPNKELSLLLALVPNKVLSLLLDDQ